MKYNLLLLLCSLFFAYSFPSIFAQNEPKTKIIEVPAEYQTVTKKVLAKKGGFTDWVKVVCEPEVTQTDIQKIKIALKDLGYDVDTLQSKDILDTKTQKAFTQFQKDYGLPVCGFPHENLKLLFEAQKKLKEIQE